MHAENPAIFQDIGLGKYQILLPGPFLVYTYVLLSIFGLLFGVPGQMQENMQTFQKAQGHRAKNSQSKAG